MSDQFVTIQSFTTEIEAQIVKGRLESEGIWSFIVTDDCGGMYPQLRLTQGVLLKVHASDQDRAVRVIAPVDSPEQPMTKPADPKETAAMLSVNAWIFGLIGLGLTTAGFLATKWFYVGLSLITVGLVLKFLSRRADR